MIHVQTEEPSPPEPGPVSCRCLYYYCQSGSTPHSSVLASSAGLSTFLSIS